MSETKVLSEFYNAAFFHSLRKFALMIKRMGHNAVSIARDDEEKFVLLKPAQKRKAPIPYTTSAVTGLKIGASIPHVGVDRCADEPLTHARTRFLTTPASSGAAPR
eukprot:CAMPEP_0170137430 /NCGR_PEP_ID=MMETSP0033_2-20121228/4152_1 /TAXON_ID=195969 /ORGANISM="Dolichomastix tenuilepis, Strain CCMP3274" /LENGTH=105 /DNA_ID=CAMNT_0010373295 /DNA_START=46 /DNA_END=360 /DNA_ORIENTATION=-